MLLFLIIIFALIASSHSTCKNSSAFQEYINHRDHAHPGQNYNEIMRFNGSTLHKHFYNRSTNNSLIEFCNMVNLQAGKDGYYEKLSDLKLCAPAGLTHWTITNDRRNCRLEAKVPSHDINYEVPCAGASLYAGALGFLPTREDLFECAPRDGSEVRVKCDQVLKHLAGACDLTEFVTCSAANHPHERPNFMCQQQFLARYNHSTQPWPGPGLFPLVWSWMFLEFKFTFAYQNNTRDYALVEEKAQFAREFWFYWFVNWRPLYTIEYTKVNYSVKTAAFLRDKVKRKLMSYDLVIEKPLELPKDEELLGKEWAI